MRDVHRVLEVLEVLDLHRAARTLGALLVLLAASGCSLGRDDRLRRASDDATLALRQGDLVGAQSLSEAGFAKSVPGSPWAWTFQFLRAEILIERLRLDEALPLVSRPLPPDRPYEPLRARQRYLEAMTDVARGRLQAALQTLDGARRLASSPDVEADVEILAGQVAFRLGRWADGESRLSAAAAHAERRADQFHLIWALNDLGMGRVVRSRWDEALPWFERVLSFSSFERYTKYTAALNNAGICYARLGEFPKALAVQQRAVQAHERRGPRRDYEQALGELGGTYNLQGDLPKALSYLQRAFAVADEARLTEDAALWARNLAETYADLGEPDEAVRFNEESRRLNPPNLGHKLVWNTLTDAKVAVLQGRLDEAEGRFKAAVAQSDLELGVRWSAYAGLADVALRRKQSVRASEYFESALDVIEKNQSGLLKTDYKMSLLNRLIQFYRQYVDALVTQQRVERALEVADSSRGRVLSERQGVAAPPEARAAAFRGVASQLGGVVLFYWLAPERSYLWIVTGALVRCVPLPPAAQIEALVREHQAAIDNTIADPLAASGSPGDRLYRVLVQPAAPWLGNGARVLIVPDGGLHRLNFETLPVDGPRRHYWIDDVEIQIAPALGLTATQSVRPTAAPTLLLIGDPTPRAPEFPALSYAAAEMRNVSQHFAADRVTVFQRGDASPAAYRGARPARFTMIHFTAHATANTESPLDSAIILSGPDGQFKLYARDVTETPLQAELVTVSACRSAGERTYSGEGLVGFAWAFLRAGTKRVVAGLWDVDDRSTAELMDRFYQRLAAGASPARALREAKLALIQRGGVVAKPYYWAPLQLFTLSP